MGQTNWQGILQEIDTVIHLAARAHQINETATDPLKEFLRVNSKGTAHLVKESIIANVKHFIFISSIGAVATLSNETLTENSSCHPDTPYGKSKLDAEKGIIDLCKDADMTWTILRPTLVYGPGNPGNMERLIKLVDAGFPLPFGAMDENQRSLVYVENLVDGIYQCIINPAAKNQIFIISDNDVVSTVRLTKDIANFLQKKGIIFNIPLKILFFIGTITGKKQTIERLVGSLSVSNSKIRDLLGWNPPYHYPNSLEKTVNWYVTSKQK